MTGHDVQEPAQRRPAGRPAAARVAVAEPRGLMDLGLLDTLLGYHLRQAELVIFRDFRTATASIGLTQAQFSVLELVAANPAVSQVGLSGQLTVDKATMMVMVDRLEQSDLLVRRASKIDRRRQELHVTPKGIRLLEKMRALIVDHERALFAELSATELSSVMRALRKIHGKANRPAGP